MSEEAIASPREAVLGSGAGGPLSAPTPWTSFTGYIQYPGGVVVGNPVGVSKGSGSINAQTLYINGTLVNLGLYLPFTGGALTGLLTLNQDPVGPLDAVDKRYVDAAISSTNGIFVNYLPLAGGTLTGPLILNADPVTPLGTATKQYVDGRTSGFTIPDAPSDGSTYGRNNAAWSNVVDAGTY